jgi:hypothetical protein
MSGFYVDEWILRRTKDDEWILRVCVYYCRTFYVELKKTDTPRVPLDVPDPRPPSQTPPDARAVPAPAILGCASCVPSVTRAHGARCPCPSTAGPPHMLLCDASRTFPFGAFQGWWPERFCSLLLVRILPVQVLSCSNQHVRCQPCARGALSSPAHGAI